MVIYIWPGTHVSEDLRFPMGDSDTEENRRFYSYWNRCYGRYHSVGRCFGYLRRKHLFSYYNGYSNVGYGAGYSGGIIYDYGYYKSHHGFAIVNNRFTYGGIGYQLKCSRSRFYTLWGQCYHRYHSVGSCFGRLRRQHLFYRYGGGIPSSQILSDNVGR
ncbi:hypothetical protein AM593_08955, partial [Mytilus galloprovincialis]